MTVRDLAPATRRSWAHAVSNREIVEACCRACNAFVADAALITSLTMRSWANVS